MLGLCGITEAHILKFDRAVSNLLYAVFRADQIRLLDKQLIATLDRMWVYDTMTGLYNRAGFLKLAENIIAENKLKKQKLISSQCGGWKSEISIPA